MKQFPPNISAKTATLLSLIIGYALIDDFTSREQNAIGNWLMTISQILESNSAWQQLNEERSSSNNSSCNDINISDIKRTLDIMQKELESFLKKKN